MLREAQKALFYSASNEIFIPFNELFILISLYKWLKFLHILMSLSSIFLTQKWKSVCFNICSNIANWRRCKLIKTEQTCKEFHQFVCPNWKWCLQFPKNLVSKIHFLILSWLFYFPWAMWCFAHYYAWCVTSQLIKSDNQPHFHLPIPFSQFPINSCDSEADQTERQRKVA